MSTTFVNIQTPESGIVKDGLVYWFVPSNSNTYPGTGTKAYDLSGTNGDSDIINTPTYNGKTFVLSNNSNQYFELPNLSLNYPLNISFIAKEPFSGTNGPCVVFSDPTNGQKSIGLGIQKTLGGGIRAWDYDGTYTSIVKTDVEYNRFYYVSVNFTSSSIDLYVDGEYDSSLAGPHTKVWTDTDTSYNIGKLNRPSTLYYPGEYGDMQIYNRALSADEIRQNMRALKSKYGMLGLTIHDAFTGSGSLAGRTPDTVSNGSVWEVPESQVTCTVGSGTVYRSARGTTLPGYFIDSCVIDIGTSGKFRIDAVGTSIDQSGTNAIGFSLFNTDGSADGTETNLTVRMSDTGALDMFDVANGVVQQQSIDRPSGSTTNPNGSLIGFRVEYDGTYVVFSIWDSTFTTKDTEITSADFTGGNFTSTPSSKCGFHWGGTYTGSTNYFSDFKVYA